MDVNIIELNSDFVIYPTAYDEFKIRLVSATVKEPFNYGSFSVIFNLITADHLNEVMESTVLGKLSRGLIIGKITEVMFKQFNVDFGEYDPDICFPEDFSVKFKFIDDFKLTCAFTWMDAPVKKETIYDVLADRYYTWAMNNDTNSVQ